MEILIALIVLAILAAGAFLWMRSRKRAPDLGGPGGGLRGPRRTRAAARHDPMAEVVERHAMAIEPQEATAAERDLQAQARRVASDLHAQQSPDANGVPPRDFVPPRD